jgi:hypothetical protein
MAAQNSPKPVAVALLHLEHLRTSDQDWNYFEMCL